MVFFGGVNCTGVMSTEIAAVEGAVGQMFLPELERISLVRKNTTQQLTIENLRISTRLNIPSYPEIPEE